MSVKLNEAPTSSDLLKKFQKNTVPLKSKKEKTKSKRSRGGQPGNQNARTHGFYARRLPQSQLEGLEDTTVRSLEDEIGVMRVFSRKVAELGAEVNDLNEAKSILNSLSNATSSINRLVRTHTRIPDPKLDPSWLLKQALLELEEEWPELKRFGQQFTSQKTSLPSTETDAQQEEEVPS